MQHVIHLISVTSQTNDHIKGQMHVMIPHKETDTGLLALIIQYWQIFCTPWTASMNHSCSTASYDESLVSVLFLGCLCCCHTQVVIGMWTCVCGRFP